MRGTTRGALTLAALAAAGQGLPGISAVGPLRRRTFPVLAGTGRPGHVALTFDDGPDPGSTPFFLEALAETKVRATFFLLGAMLERCPSLAAEIVDAGHEVAAHGWDHRYLPLRGPRAVRDDLTRVHDLIGAVTGETPAWWRPPYGVLSGPALCTARRLGMRPVLWTAWGRDWTRRATADSVHDTALRGLYGGGTLLLHDSDCTSAPGSWRATLGALPRVLQSLASLDLEVGPLREHALP